MEPPKWLLLKGKVAAITGGTTGIGRAITLEYIRQGCKVAVNHLGLPSDEHHLRSLLEEATEIIKQVGEDSGDLIEVEGDVRDPETGTKLVKETVEKWGRLDIFVSNAGVCKFAEFLS